MPWFQKLNRLNTNLITMGATNFLFDVLISFILLVAIVLLLFFIMNTVRKSRQIGEQIKFYSASDKQPIND